MCVWALQEFHGGFSVTPDLWRYFDKVWSQGATALLELQILQQTASAHLKPICNNPPAKWRTVTVCKCEQHVDNRGEKSMLLMNLYYSIIIWLIKKTLRFASPVVLYSINTNKRKIHFLIPCFDIWCGKNVCYCAIKNYCHFLNRFFMLFKSGKTWSLLNVILILS